MVTNYYWNYLLSFLFAFLFIYIIPWVTIYGSEFVDIYNYVERLEYLARDGKEADLSPVQWILSEPLWKEFLYLITYITDDYRNALYGLSFFSAFVYFSFILKRVEFYIAIIFLFNPMVIDLFIGQIRNAVAFSLVLLTYDLYESKKIDKNFALFLFLSAIFIHVSMLVYYSIYFVLYKLNSMIEDKKYYLVTIGIALFIALFMKYGSNILLSLIGDRHADYENVIGSSSLSYSIAWFIIAMILATFANFKNSQERILVAYVITILSFFFFSSLLGMFAARYAAVIMPLTIVAISFLPKHFKQGTYLFLLFYNLFSFKYWLVLTVL